MTQTITIESLSHDGRGVAHQNGKTIFIENALPNETVAFTVTKKRSQFDEAKATTILTASPDRVAPQCEHFSICGGCSLQHLASHAQIQYKEKIALEHLQHIGKIKIEQLAPALTAYPWGYRHKARLGVKFDKKKQLMFVGFREKNSNLLAYIKQCEILHPAVGKKINLLRELIFDLDGKAIIPQIEIAVTEQRTALIFRHMEALSANDLIKLENFAAAENIYLYLQPGGPESIKLYYPSQPDDLLYYKLPAYNLEFAFHPTDFIQINPAINANMIAQAIAWLKPEKNEKLLDLFCGLGNFTLSFARFCQHITGVEGDLNMVQRATVNAAHNQISNAQFFKTNLTGELKWSHWAREKYDKIVLDPPRSGAWEVVQYLPTLAATQILYISCNTATLARDAAELIKQGYQLKQMGVMDMFPHTSHIEAMALFVKKRNYSASRGQHALLADLERK